MRPAPIGSRLCRKTRRARLPPRLQDQLRLDPEHSIDASKGPPTPPGEVANHELVLGMDYGTSFSSAAAWVDERLYLAVDERGEPCIPSVLYLPEEGPVLVGIAAARRSLSEPHRIIRGLKRIIGRTYRDPEVRIFEAQNAVQVKEGPGGGVLITTRNDEYAPIQLVAAVYRHLKELAERRFSRPIEKAVITVPACVPQAVVRATSRAAEIAGLEIVRVVPEPCAGAIAQSLDRFQGQRKVLVYDFGGGTFDVTVLHQEEGLLEPHSMAGDPCLGGADLDEALAQHVAGHVHHQHGIDLTRDVVRWNLVLQRSEQVKRALSSAPRVHFRLRDLFSSGPHRDLQLAVDRSQVEPRWRPLVDRTIRLTAETMVESGLSPDKLDAIVLVGGSTYMPLVRQRIVEVLKKPGLHHGDPQTSVACGAALVGVRSLSIAA